MKSTTANTFRLLFTDSRRLRWLLLALIPLLAIPAWWPLTTAGFPKTHDGSVHLMRLFLIDQQIGAGNLFPRWLPDLFLGYGYPVLDFYAPVIYYATKFLSLVGLDFLQAYALLIGVSILVAGWGMYLLAASLFENERDPRGEWAGLAAAVAYMYTPYLLVNIYVRGALAEMVAQALLPFVFWSTLRLFTAPRPLRYGLITAASIAALALTHNITLLFLPTLLITYVLVIIWRQQRQGVAWRQRFLWFLGAGVTAMVVTTFFWLPVLLERRYLGPSTFDMGKELSIHVWEWRNFLESRWPYDHQRTGIPFRLGLAQLALALIGLVITGRRGALWWYWVVWGALCIAAVTPFAIPLWNTSAYLQLAQFPWRLLTIISLSMAVVTGGIVTAFNRSWLQIGAAAAIIVVMILGNVPRRDPYNGSVYADVEINPAVIARYESVRGAYGAGWHREFLPTWSTQFDSKYANWPDDAAPDMQVQLVDVAPTAITVATDSATGGALRLNQFYFPGWEAQLDGGEPLALTSTTNRGVVTAQAPAGAHTIRFSWTESSVQRIAEWVTILGLAGLATFLWVRRRRWLAGITGAVAILAGVILLKPPAATNTPFVATDVQVAPGLRLLGYRTEQSAGGRHLLVTPYWYVSAPLQDMELQWTLLDAQGAVQSSATSAAYFDAIPFESLAPGSVVRDGYRLELPWSQPATDYTLQVQPVSEETGSLPATTLGALTAAPTPNITPLHLLLTDPQSNDQAWLDGYTLTINGTPMAIPKPGEPQHPPTIRPGDRVEYVLYWRANGKLAEDYHSFMHVVDSDRITAVSLDKVPGTEISRPILWDDVHTERDTFTFQGPDKAVGGLYYPRLGLYDFSDLDRFLIQSQDGTPIGDGFDLPPLKLVNSVQGQPAEKLAAKYGDFAELLGYDVSLPGEIVYPGDAITLTVYYRGLGPAPADYTQFFQLYDPALGMAAQLDQPPLHGGNPTSTWTAGEVIADRVVLTVMPDAAPGVYALNTGLYNPGDGTRVGITHSDGSPFADNQAPLLQVQVGARQE